MPRKRRKRRLILGNPSADWFVDECDWRIRRARAAASRFIDRPDPDHVRDNVRGIIKLMRILLRRVRATPEIASTVRMADRLGYHYAEIVFGNNLGPEARSGRKQRKKSPTAGRASGQTRRTLADKRRELVEADFRAERAVNPNPRKLSRTAIAERIADRRGFPRSTVRSDVKILGLK
jgi:hypothetical protein